MANGDLINNWGLTSRALPGANVDNTYSPMRVSRRGETINQPLDRFALADEGSYFVWHNATNDASTTVAGHAAPVLADADATLTKPIVFIRNTDAITEGRRAYLDFIELEVVTAPTGNTTSNWAAQLDSGTTRYSSGGEDATILNPNMQSSAACTFTCKLGAVVASAETSAVRHLGHGQIRAAIDIIGDRYCFLFGRDPSVGANVVATAASRHAITMPPVILGPTDSFLLALYGPSWSAAAVYKIRGGFWVR